MKATGNTTQWVKMGRISRMSFIARDVICYSVGCHAVFINLTTGEELSFTANSHSGNGDGISVLRGHRSANVFAYAENCRNAAIFVKTYPNFQTITKLISGPSDGYIAMTFSETSLLVTLGNLPDFVLIIWNWRSGEKFSQLNSGLPIERQMLACSYQKPFSLVQLGLESNQLFFWDLHVCCKQIFMKKNTVKLPKLENFEVFVDVLWTTEGGIYILDRNGCIYTIDNEFALERVVEVSLVGSNCPSMAWYKAGIVVSGPDKNLRHYKKSGAWICDWTIPLDIGMNYMISNKSDSLIGVNDETDIVRISNVDGISKLRPDMSGIRDFCLINPVGEFIVALRKRNILNLYHVETGKSLSTFELQGNALALTENPDFPYIAATYDNGYIELVSAYNPEKLSHMASFHLSSDPIQKLRFFEDGRILVTASMDKGDIFVIEGLPGTQMKVIAHVETNCQIVDYILVASKSCYRLFVIPVTAKFLAGNKIIRYCIIDKDNINVKEYYFESEDSYYHGLLPTRKLNRDRVFYAIPFTSKNIHVIETRRGDSFVKVSNEIKTGHQLRHFDVRITQNHGLTWGFDGFVMARCKKFDKRIGMVLSHHRYQGGVKKALIDPLGKYVVSLGRDDVLVCTNLVSNEIDEDLRRSLVETKESTKYALMFKRPTIGFKPEGKFQNKTWVEVNNILKFEEEELQCREAKQDILREFKEIKTTLSDLVTENIEGPENEKLDLVEFYLDTKTYNQMKQRNKEDCKQEEIYLKALIEAQDKVSQYILKTYLDPMDVKGRMIRGIFQNVLSTNYTLLPVKQESAKRLAWVEEQRRVETFLSVNDNFEPWLNIKRETLKSQLLQPLQLTTKDYGSMTARKFLEEAIYTQLSLDSQIALVGSVSQLYINRNGGHYKQRQIVSFYQCDLQQTIAENEVIKLKQEHNKAFVNLVELKYREMENIKEKHERLRHIISEYNYFSKNKIDLDIVDPVWTQDEEPWLIATVLEDELTITPYISPSEQALLDAKAAEEERIRLALLADDFRERALMAMMNGVLEIRWEDELKKDVPLPKCMVEKDPAQFNEEDLRAVRDYEEKVAFLNSERERYKNILDVEFTKLSITVRDSIRKFNQKVKDTMNFKMFLDSGMNQENLRVNRSRFNQEERIKLYRREEEIERTMRNNEIIIQQLHETIAKVNEALNECKLSLETLQSKEKLLEKAFRRDFQEASPVVQELALKLYKKRPRANFRQMNTVAGIFELAKCVVTQEKSLILTQDGLEYLKAVDQLDQFVGLPPTIDEHTHNLICKHRRLRLEYEIRLRGTQVQIQDGEATVATFQKRVAFKKEKNMKLLAEMQKTKTDYLYLMHNIQIQIVLRRGLVEIPLTGDVTDFKDAILVPKVEIEQINEKIRQAGDKKLQTMIQNMAFRRNIMATEWQHKKLRMQINDLMEQIRDIENIKFTREMQMHYKSKSVGRKTDIDSFEQEIEVISAAFENNIRNRKEKLKKIHNQIQSYKDHNAALDKAIQEKNIDVCHLKLQEDLELECKENTILKSRMDALLRRSSLVQEIQKNHNEILVLQTELELLRLRTYPTFKYKLINTDE